MTISLKRLPVLIILTLGIVGILALLHSTPAAAASLSQSAPTPANSTDGNGNPGAHVFFIRKAATQGIQDKIRLSAYYNTSAQASNATITLTPGTTLTDPNVCNRIASNDPSYSNTYLSVQITNAANTARQRTYYISYAHACDRAGGYVNAQGVNGNNIFYADYVAPNVGAAELDPDGTGLYKLDIEIAYDPDVPKPASNAQGFAQRIVVRTPVSGAKIGPLGGQSRSFPILGDWDIIASSDPAVQAAGKPTKIIIPFGMACNAPGNTIQGNASIYDADNGNLGGSSPGFYPHYVQMKVQQKTSSGWQDIAFSAGDWTDGTMSAGNTIFQPEDGLPQAGHLPRVRVTMTKKVNYRLVITDIMPRNTIDVGLPGDAIFGDIVCGDPKPCVTYDPVTCPAPTKLDDESVILQANPTGNGDVETGTSATMGGSVNVDNYPEPEPGGWGWDEVATRRAVNNNIVPQQNSYAATNAGQTGIVGTAQRECQSGWATSCGTYHCAAGFASSCGNYRWRCSWNGKTTPLSTDSPYYITGNANWGVNNAASVCAVIQYQCYDANGVLQNDYRDFANRASPSANPPTTGCGKRWLCSGPSGGVSPVVTYDPNYNAGVCRVFRCAYDSSNSNPFYAPGNNPDGNCALRCNNGAGAPAYNHSNGDENCYVQPYFRITCQWTGSDGQTFSEDEVVSGNGDYCQHPPKAMYNIASGVINSQACISLRGFSATANNFTASNGTSWLPATVQPGHGTFDYKGGVNGGPTGVQRFIYRNWTIGEDTASVCVDVYGKPYFKVYGSDVRVGDAIDDTICSPTSSPNTAASISAWNAGTAGGFRGAGTQYAVMALGSINGFASGQNNPNGNPAFGSPTAGKLMTFANSGGEYGEGFEASLNCTAYVPAGTTVETGDQTIGTLSVAGGTQKVRHIQGDVYIDGDVTYSSLGGSVNNLTSYRVVVEGNIYIDNDVHRLDGTYVAVPDSGGNGGTIVTCTIGHSVPSTTLSGCEDQLVVNGALVAQKVRLLRDCGSLRYSTVGEGYIFTGASGNLEQCSGGTNHAAEVFNYTPDIWLTSLKDVPGKDQGDDTIKTLPPIL
jgi:hypothetical protein